MPSGLTKSTSKYNSLVRHFGLPPPPSPLPSSRLVLECIPHPPHPTLPHRATSKPALCIKTSSSLHPRIRIHPPAMNAPPEPRSSHPARAHATHDTALCVNLTPRLVPGSSAPGKAVVRPFCQPLCEVGLAVCCLGVVACCTAGGAVPD